MNRTNSNSITSILIYSLNETKSEFRKMMLKKISEIFADTSFVDKDYFNDIYFYDGMNSPLQLKTMKKKKVDIYARKFGEQKIRLMIEVKASISEALQDSQKKNGEYYKTATAKGHEIPLLYIVPENYHHEEKLEENNIIKIINWNYILKLIGSECKNNNGLKKEICHFVDIAYKSDYTVFDENENALLNNPKKMRQVYSEQRVSIRELIKTGDSNCRKDQFSCNDNEFGYYFDAKKFFLGYSYIRCDYDYKKLKYVFFLNIFENNNNNILGEKGYFYDEGWYYIPIEPIDNIKMTLKDLKDDNDISPQIYHNIKLDKIINEFSKKEKNTKNICNIYNTIKLLCEKSTVLNTDDISIMNLEKHNSYFGYYFHEKKRHDSTIFVGIDELDDDKKEGLYLVLEYYKKKWIKIPLNKFSEEFNCFADSKKFDDLHNNFDILIQKALNEVKQ